MQRRYLLLLFSLLWVGSAVAQEDGGPGMTSRRHGQMRQITTGVYAELTYSYDKLRIYLMDGKRLRIPTRSIPMRGEVHYPKELHRDPIKVAFDRKGDHYKGRIGILDDVKRFTVKLEFDIEGETHEAQFIVRHPPRRRVRTPDHLRQPTDYRY